MRTVSFHLAAEVGLLQSFYPAYSSTLRKFANPSFHSLVKFIMVYNARSPTFLCKKVRLFWVLLVKKAVQLVPCLSFDSFCSDGSLRSGVRSLNSSFRLEKSRDWKRVDAAKTRFPEIDWSVRCGKNATPYSLTFAKQTHYSARPFFFQKDYSKQITILVLFSWTVLPLARLHRSDSYFILNSPPPKKKY